MADESGFFFHQLFDDVSSTYTYVLADKTTGEAAIVDSVEGQAERDIKLLEELNLTLKYCISTHVHADHVTGNTKLKEIVARKTNASTTVTSPPKSVISAKSGAKADLHVDQTSALELGQCVKLKFIFTPGHTNGCMTIVDHQHRLLFTGDTLLIRGCGRTDLQGGSSFKLYQSVHDKLFILPDDYQVYPAHDYNGRKVSTIGEEKALNPRLTERLEEFIAIMDNLNLPKPKLIDVAVPRNLVCGV